MPRTVPLEVRLWTKVEFAHPRECWMWQGAVDKDGYGDMGRVGKDPKRYKAHRVAWEQWNGPIPDGLSVLHHCDTPGCVNPYHLFLGTTRDNLADMRAKGRHPIGEAHANAKLTTEAVLAIRSSTESSTVLGERYGVHHGYISLVRTGKRWKHVAAR